MKINVDEFVEKLIANLRGVATSKLDEVRMLPLHNWSQHYYLFLKTSVPRAVAETLKQFGIPSGHKRMRMQNRLLKIVYSFLKHLRKDFLKENIEMLLREEGYL